MIALNIGEKYRIKPDIEGQTQVIFGGCIPPEKHKGHIVELIGIDYERTTGWPQYMPDVDVKCIDCGEKIRFNSQFLTKEVVTVKK